MQNLNIYLLGSPYLELDGKITNLVTRKNIALLAYLAITKGMHNREELTTLLWPDLDPKRARANVRRDLSVLRKILGRKRIEVDGGSISLETGDNYYLDIDHFHELLQGCIKHQKNKDDSCQECVNSLISAMDLYRGNFLEGFSLRDSSNFDEWQYFQTESLRQEFANGLERLVCCLFTQEEYEAAISYARRWLALDPLNELPHRELMRLYAASDQRNAALRQYQECVRVLQDELGISPERETKTLFEQIKENRFPRKSMEIDAQPAKENKYFLPVQPTPFIGRDVELEKLSLMLNDPNTRLVTIMGAGGMGKTHLALELGKENLDLFPDGVFFIPLASLDSANSIIPTVAKILDLPFIESNNPGEQLLDYLSDKILLLIMDNFEHLLEGGTWVTEVLKRTMGVKILATSKEKLNLLGEQLFPIIGMEYPPIQSEFNAEDYVTLVKNLEQYSAIKLFSHTASQSKPDFVINNDNIFNVIEICSQVQGMPLAILLAAAWVDTIEPSEIASEIEKGIDFLESDIHDVPERHRSLHAVFEHTWQLLTERERKIFMAISVFRGGFTRQAFNEVIGSPISELRSLINKSLLVYKHPNRYEIHELLRQFAEYKVEAQPTYNHQIQQRHAAFFAKYINQLEADINGSDPLQALAEIEIEIGNARKAWTFAAINHDINLLNQAIDGINNFYIWKKRYTEGVNLCDLAMKELDGINFGIDSTIIPRTLIWRAIFQLRLGQIVDANNDLQHASKILGTLNSAGFQTIHEDATIQLQQGHIAFDQNLDEAQYHYENSLALFREANDIRGSADALMVLGWVNWHRGAYETANTLFEESHALRCSLGDKRRIIESQSGLGFLAMFQGNFQEAEQLMLESHRLLEEIGIQMNLIFDFPSKTDPAAIIDKEYETMTQYRKSVGLYSDLGFRYCLVPVHSIHGYIQKHLGQYYQASSVGKMGYNLASKIGWKQEMGLCLELLGDIAIVMGQFIQAEDYIKSCISIYQETKQIDISSAFASLGYIAIGSGQYAQAKAYLANSLRKATEVQAQYPITHAIPAIALLFAVQGEIEQAVELYAFAKRYQRVANSRWFEDVVGKKIGSVANKLPLEIITAAEKRGIKRELQTTVSELLFELESGQRFGLMSV